MNIVNERIKSRRISLGLTLLDIAEYLGVREATVQRYESGEIKNIKHETIQNMASILKCSPAYLMGWEDEVHQDPIEKELSEEQILTLAAHQVGHKGPLTPEQMSQIKLAVKIALAKEEK